MIVQTAPKGQTNFVIEHTDHALTCGQIARAFGNNLFAMPEPAEPLIYATEHHDEGWAPIDALWEQSPSTGLPHHLTQTPIKYLLETSKGSPAFNEAHHPFSGLLSSMHTYGLFNGRYGLSDFIFIDKMPEAYQPAAQEMLENELARQIRIKEDLGASAETSAWLKENQLFTHYKLLQFFDTLGLYFQITHATDRTETQFLNVPDGKGNDHTITISPLENGMYSLTPFPFKGEILEITTEGRYLSPQPEGTDFKTMVKTIAKEQQTYQMVHK